MGVTGCERPPVPSADDTSRPNPSAASPGRRRSRTACRRPPQGRISSDALEALFDDAVARHAAPLRGDGLARRSPTASSASRASRRTRSTGSPNIAPGGVTIPFEDGHTRQLPLLTERPVPLRHARRASYLDGAPRRTRPAPLKQAVISASALSLLYPGDGLDGLLARGVPRGPRRTRRQTSIRRMPRRAAPPRRSTSPRGASRSSSIPRAACSMRSSTSTTSSSRGLTAEERVEDRRPHLPGRRPGLDAQRRRRLRRAAARPVSARRRNVLRPARERGGPRARARGSWARSATDDRRIFVGVIDPIDPRVETPEEVARPRPRGGQVHRSRRTSARPTTAASRRSATTRRPRATPRSRRSRRGSRERGSPRSSSGSSPGDQAAAAPLMRSRPPYAPLDHATTSMARPMISHT